MVQYEKSCHFSNQKMKYFRVSFFKFFRTKLKYSLKNGKREKVGLLFRNGASTCHEVQSLSKRAFKLTLEALHEVDEGECLNREPVILVLDFDVQMLPWESSPIVRNQEVYRMPSIGSIFAVLDRCCQFQEHDAKNAGIFPLINPLDVFYLLNPSGDLNGTHDKLEDFFRERNLEVIPWVAVYCRERNSEASKLCRYPPDGLQQWISISKW